MPLPPRMATAFSWQEILVYRLHFGTSWPEVPQGIQRRSPSGTLPTHRVAIIPIDNAFRHLGFPVLWKRPGVGAGTELPHKLTDYRRCSGADFAVEWGRILSCSRCRRRNGTAKIQTVKEKGWRFCECKILPAPP